MSFWVLALVPRLVSRNPKQTTTAGQDQRAAQVRRSPACRGCPPRADTHHGAPVSPSPPATRGFPGAVPSRRGFSFFIFSVLFVFVFIYFARRRLPAAGGRGRACSHPATTFTTMGRPTCSRGPRVAAMATRSRLSHTTPRRVPRVSAATRTPRASRHTLPCVARCRVTGHAVLMRSRVLTRQAGTTATATAGAPATGAGAVSARWPRRPRLRQFRRQRCALACRAASREMTQPCISVPPLSPRATRAKLTAASPTSQPAQRANIAAHYRMQQQARGRRSSQRGAPYLSVAPLTLRSRARPHRPLPLLLCTRHALGAFPGDRGAVGLGDAVAHLAAP